MKNWYVYSLLLLASNQGFAKTTIQSIERIHHAIDDKICTSTSGANFKNAVTVISGKGVVTRNSDKHSELQTISVADNEQLFWCKQSTLVRQLKELAATSKELALKALHDALYARYLDTQTPLLSFIRDLDTESKLLTAQPEQNNHNEFVATLELLATTVNNLLLW